MSDRTSSSSVLDEYLVIESRVGDSRAFAWLVRRWHPRLVRHAYGFTRDMDAARDVAQESWMAVIRGLHLLRDPASFRAWAFRIVANKARDWIRREQARRRATEAAEVKTDPGLASAAIRRLRTVLAELEPAQRNILTWFYLDEMSIREIADSLDVPAGTVKSRLFYARDALRTAFEET